MGSIGCLIKLNYIIVWFCNKNTILTRATFCSIKHKVTSNVADIHFNEMSDQICTISKSSWSMKFNFTTIDWLKLIAIYLYGREIVYAFNKLIKNVWFEWSTHGNRFGFVKDIYIYQPWGFNVYKVITWNMDEFGQYEENCKVCKIRW